MFPLIESVLALFVRRSVRFRQGKRVTVYVWTKRKGTGARVQRNYVGRIVIVRQGSKWRGKHPLYVLVNMRD